MSIAQPTREVAWASSAAGGDIAEPSDAQKLAGWTGTPAPPYQWFNWILWKAAAWISYLRARGIPDYDPIETYSIGDRVQGSDGKTYTCIQANTPAAAKDPTTQAAYWERWGVSTAEATDIADAEIDTKLGTLSGETTAGIAASDSATIQTAHHLNMPGTTHKIIAFVVRLSLTGGAGGTTVTFSDATAFATGAKTCQVTNSDSGVAIATAQLYGKVTGAQTVNVAIVGAGAVSTADVSVSVTGW